MEKSKKNKKNCDNELKLINERKDVKGKKMMSKNEEDTIRTLKKYFETEAKLYDEFLGKDGVKKLLNGREIGWTSLLDIREIIENDIMPLLDKNMDKVLDNIKSKYGKNQQYDCYDKQDHSLSGKEFLFTVHFPLQHSRYSLLLPYPILHDKMLPVQLPYRHLQTSCQ